VPLCSSSQAAVRTALVTDLIILWRGLATSPLARVEKRGLATSPRARAEVADDMFSPPQAGPPASEGTFYYADQDVVEGLMQMLTDQRSDDLVLCGRETSAEISITGVPPSRLSAGVTGDGGTRAGHPVGASFGPDLGMGHSAAGPLAVAASVQPTTGVEPGEVLEWRKGSLSPLEPGALRKQAVAQQGVGRCRDLVGVSSSKGWAECSELPSYPEPALKLPPKPGGAVAFVHRRAGRCMCTRDRLSASWPAGSFSR